MNADTMHDPLRILLRASQVRVFQLFSQKMKRFLPPLLLTLLLSPCFVQGNPLTAEKKDLRTRSIDELIQILEFAETEEKIMVLNELRDRGETASRALPYVVKIGLNIMAAYPSDPSDWDSFMKTSKPLFPALWAIRNMGNARTPGASQAVEFLVDMLRYRDGEIPFQGDHVDIVEVALVSFDGSSLVFEGTISMSSGG